MHQILEFVDQNTFDTVWQTFQSGTGELSQLCKCSSNLNQNQLKVCPPPPLPSDPTVFMVRDFLMKKFPKDMPSSSGGGADAILAAAIAAMQQQGLMQDLISAPPMGDTNGTAGKNLDYESGLSSSSLSDILSILLNESSTNSYTGIESSLLNPETLPSPPAGTGTMDSSGAGTGKDSAAAAGGGRRSVLRASTSQQQQIAPLAVNDPLYRNGSQWFHSRVQNGLAWVMMTGKAWMHWGFCALAPFWTVTHSRILNVLYDMI